MAKHRARSRRVAARAALWLALSAIAHGCDPAAAPEAPAIDGRTSASKARARGAESAQTPEQKRKARMRRARRMAWEATLPRFRHPSEIPPALRDEMGKHWRRVALLERIRVLAVASRDRGARDRADALLTRERSRYQRRVRLHLDALAKAAAPAPEE